ncbi:SCO6880 family protein [Rothia sp. P5764]|uniref:SCO6880 family protein n=1 Tax=Rothia sp. P5764 TaxID=3402654 RepID=UPI003AC61D1A
MSTEEKIELAPVRIPRQEKTGIVLGLSLVPLIAFGVSILLALISLFIFPFPWMIVAFFFWLTLGAIFGWVRIKKRTLFEWIPHLHKAMLRRLTGQSGYRRPAERADSLADEEALERIRIADEKSRTEALEWNEPEPGITPRPVKFTLPGQANEFQVYNTPEGRGILHDPVTKRVSAVVQIKNTKSFDLQDDDVKGERIDQYGLNLDVVLANRYVEAIIPTDITSLQSPEQSLNYYRSQVRLNGADPNINPIAAQGYEDYLARNLMTYHMQYYTFVFSVDEMRTLIREHGSNMAGLLSAIDTLCRSLEDDLSSNKIDIEHWLNARERVEAAYETFTLNKDEPIVGAYAYWSSLRANACWHRAYVIDEWPQKDIKPGFMSKLTKDLQFRHAVSIVYEAGYSDEALTKVSHAIQDKEIALDIKRKAGQRISLADRTEVEDLEQREAELVAGSSEVVMRAFISITASTKEELEKFHSQTIAASKRSGLVLYPCWDQQFAGVLAAGALAGVGID